MFDFPNRGPIGDFGCAFQRGRAYRLSEPDLGIDSNGFIGDTVFDEPVVLALAGTKVAYTFPDDPSGRGPIRVLRVLDVAAGRLLHTVFTPQPDASSGKKVIAGFEAVILQPDGTVVWTASFSDSSTPPWLPPLTEVGVADSSGWRTLDRSAPSDPAGAIDSHSLHLASAILTWKHGAISRTAPLH